jgi:hypothetical protein
MNPVWKLIFFLFNIEGYGEFFSGITPILPWSIYWYIHFIVSRHIWYQQLPQRTRYLSLFIVFLRSMFIWYWWELYISCQTYCIYLTIKYVKIKLGFHIDTSLWQQLTGKHFGLFRHIILTASQSCSICLYLLFLHV